MCRATQVSQCVSGAHKTLRHIKKQHDELGTEFVFNRTVSSLLLTNDGIVEHSTNSVVADGKTEDLRHHVPIVVIDSAKALADLFRKPVVVLIVRNQHGDIHGFRPCEHQCRDREAPASSSPEML